MLASFLSVYSRIWSVRSCEEEEGKHHFTNNFLGGIISYVCMFFLHPNRVDWIVYRSEPAFRATTDTIDTASRCDGFRRRSEEGRERVE